MSAYRAVVGNYSVAHLADVVNLHGEKPLLCDNYRMAVTTTTRFGIYRWSGGSDPLNRDQMDQSHALIESKGAIWTKGATGARPAAGASNDRSFYLDTDTGTLYYSNGTVWTSVGTYAVPTATAPGNAQAIGASPHAANADHVHASLPWALVGAISTVGTTPSAGVANSYARGDHSHVLGTASVTAGTIAAGGVSASDQIANAIITANHFAPGAVGSGSLSADQRPVTGGVILFTGTVAPTGWLLCDGASYTTAGQAALFAVIGYKYGGSGANFNVPNMIERVPRGATTPGTGSTLGVTGGADTVAVPVLQHSHGVGSIGVANAGNHTHNWTGSTGLQSADHAHGIYGTTDAQGAHNHSPASFTDFIAQNFGGANAIDLNAGTGASVGSTTVTSTNGSHAHNITGGTYGVNANHNHAVSGSNDSQGTHTHVLSGSTDNTGTAGATMNVQNKFATFNYIIKV